MKTVISIFILLILASCAGKSNKADGIINVFVWGPEVQGNRIQLWDGEVKITYNAKNDSPKKFDDEIEIREGIAVFENMKVGKYCITFEGSSEVKPCSYYFKLRYETESWIALHSGTNFTEAELK